MEIGKYQTRKKSINTLSLKNSFMISNEKLLADTLQLMVLAFARQTWPKITHFTKGTITKLD